MQSSICIHLALRRSYQYIAVNVHVDFPLFSPLSPWRLGNPAACGFQPAVPPLFLYDILVLDNYVPPTRLQSILCCMHNRRAHDRDIPCPSCSVSVSEPCPQKPPFEAKYSLALSAAPSGITKTGCQVLTRSSSSKICESSTIGSEVHRYAELSIPPVAGFVTEVLKCHLCCAELKPART